MSRIIETLELFDKKLIIDFKVAEIEYKFSDAKYRTSKYLRFEDWQQIYAELQKSLPSISCLKEFKDQKFYAANDIEVRMKKLPLLQSYLDLLLLNEFQVLPHILQIQISKVNVSELIRKVRKLQKEKNPASINVRKDLFREYDPVKASGGGANDAPTYKPSAKVGISANDEEGIQDGERYSPKPITNSSIEKNSLEEADGSSESEYNPNSKEDQSPIVPTYTPSQITKDLKHSKQVGEEYQPENLDPEKAKADSKKLKKTHSNHEIDQPRLHSSKETYRNRHQSKKRRKSNDIKDELFGSDDSDNNNLPTSQTTEKQILRAKRVAMKTGKKTDKVRLKDDKKTDDSSEKRRKGEPGGVDSLSPGGWLQKERSRGNIKPKKDVKEQIVCTEEESQKLEYKIQEMKNLKHLSTESLLNSFNEFKPILNIHFQRFCKQKTHAVEEIDGTMLSMMSMITESKSSKMIRKLKKVYEDQTTKECSDLFCNIMLPEWLLAIFMKEHKMSRMEALISLNQPNVSIESV